jgi:hypothetical protein
LSQAVQEEAETLRGAVDSGKRGKDLLARSDRYAHHHQQPLKQPTAFTILLNVVLDLACSSISNGRLCFTICSLARSLARSLGGSVVAWAALYRRWHAELPLGEKLLCWPPGSTGRSAALSLGRRRATADTQVYIYPSIYRKPAITHVTDCVSPYLHVRIYLFIYIEHQQSPKRSALFHHTCARGRARGTSSAYSAG